ncbi:hypothetical protein [Actinomycetospora sp. NBC_00405]|uniref:hypothetical protein n=1 Tax=Actinomycetospora sp. NBC_00405 TaxID=2975952 RepID=UPI002E226F0C
MTPAQAASPLAARPYDLRHAALTSWLNAGAPPTEVAERAGHSVKVLLSVYAACLDGEREAYNGPHPRSTRRRGLIDYSRSVP